MFGYENVSFAAVSDDSDDDYWSSTSSEEDVSRPSQQQQQQQQQSEPVIRNNQLSKLKKLKRKKLIRSPRKIKNFEEQEVRYPKAKVLVASSKLCTSKEVLS